MKKLTVLSAAAVAMAVISLAPAARASTFLFTGSLTPSGAVVVSLDITTGGAEGAGVAITGVTGTILGDAVTLLGSAVTPPGSATSPDGAWLYDNVLYPALNSPFGTAFDNPGLLVLNTVTNTDVNIFSPGSDAPYILGQSPGQSQVDLFGSLTATPLPSTWTMLVAGFAGLGLFAFRGMKKRSVAVAAA